MSLVASEAEELGKIAFWVKRERERERERERKLEVGTLEERKERRRTINLAHKT